MDIHIFRGVVLLFTILVDNESFVSCYRLGTSFSTVRQLFHPLESISSPLLLVFWFGLRLQQTAMILRLVLEVKLALMMSAIGIDV